MTHYQPLPFHVKEELEPMARLFLQRPDWNSDQLAAQGIAESGRKVSGLNALKGWEITATHRAGTARKLRQYYCLSSPADPQPGAKTRKTPKDRRRKNSTADTAAMMNDWARRTA